MLVDEIRELYHEKGMGYRCTHKELLRRGHQLKLCHVHKLVQELGLARTKETGWKLSHRKHAERQCQRCGDAYSPGSAHQSYCSDCGNRRYARYGLTETQYLALFDAQNGKCAICDKKFDVNNIDCIDHCHTSGAVRGLLCRYCNSKLAALEDQAWKRKAETYLSKKQG